MAARGKAAAADERPARISDDELSFLGPANRRAQEAAAVVREYLGHLGAKYGPLGAESIDAYTGAITYRADEPAGEQAEG